MKVAHLLGLGLVLVVMCDGVSTGEEVAVLAAAGGGASAEPDGEARSMLAVPAKPNDFKTMKELENVPKKVCEEKCSSDALCAGFEYSPGEKVCKLFKKQTPDKQISLKRAKKLMKRAVKDALTKQKEKDQKKKKKALKSQVKAMAPQRKKPSSGQKFREADKKMGLRQKAYHQAKKNAKEMAKKSKGARAAEVITKAHEHQEMMDELKAAKAAQAANLNFEEQVIMAAHPGDKNVIIAKAHKTAAMMFEEKADASFTQAKRVMKRGLKLQVKMKELKIKAVQRMVQAKTKAKKAEAKHKLAGKAYKAEERREKNARDEQKEKMAAKARIYLKQQNKKAERHNKATEAAEEGDKEKKMKKCQKAQIKMRALKYKLKRRLKKQVYARERKEADKQVERLNKGTVKEEQRKAKELQKGAAVQPVQKMREEFDMSKEDVAQLMDDEELGESGDAPVDTKAESDEVGKLKMEAEKSTVAATFKRKEQVDATTAAGQKSKEVSEKSEEVNALNLEVKGAKTPVAKNEATKKIAAIQPDLTAAQIKLKKMEDIVVELKNAADELQRTADANSKAAESASGELQRNEDAASAAKLKLTELEQEAKKKERKAEFDMKKSMLASEAVKIDRIRKTSRKKADAIIKIKWAEMKRTLKLKTVHCNPEEETESAKLKKKVKSLQKTLAKLQGDKKKKHAKAERRKAIESMAKSEAKDDAQVKEKEFEADSEAKEKAAVKQVKAVAAAEVGAAKDAEAKEKVIAQASEKKADVAAAEAKAEADKLKAVEQEAAADKLSPK